MSVLGLPSAASDALVLRAWPCGETSAIASLLTRDQGFVRVLAKAARRPRSRLRALVEPGRLVNVEFGLDPRRELQYLRGGSVLLDPLAVGATLERSAYLLGALELVDRCRPATPGPGDPGEALLFGVCEEFVGMLSSATCHQPAVLFFALEWRLLARHGTAPQVGLCSCCGADPAGAGAGSAWFQAAEGGLVCGRCTA
ncbi:MAG: DNA repair protein RecO, partial [Krumholzibacteria bacterium]|nr:DNA repair protein RecO [Candidatus Krumholzibacteria bacterium]